MEPVAAEGTQLKFPQYFGGLAERNRTRHVVAALERQEHIKTPSTSSDGGGVFCTADPIVLEGAVMPAWLEVLLDVLAFGGFIAIASLRGSPPKDGKGASRFGSPPPR